MFKIYMEHPEFYEFSSFDTKTGRLEPITEEKFRQFLPAETAEEWRRDPERYRHGIHRISGNGTEIFLGETSASHTRFPRRIYFQITRRCNLNCPTCFIKASKFGAHVPTSAIMEIAAFMGRYGLMEVRLTGGEPTIHPDFLRIIEAFQKEEIYVSVATNGVISRNILEGLSEIRNLYLICSIDGNRKTHNLYRGDTFDTIIRNLLFLKEHNPDIRLRLTTVLTKKNKDQMFEIAKLTGFLDAESLTVIPLRPQVRDQKIVKQMVTGQEFKEVIEELITAKEILGIKFTTTIETDYSDKIYKDPIFRKHSSCAAGREGTNLDFDARKKEFVVYGCSYSPAVDFDAQDEIRSPFVAGTFRIDAINRFPDIWKEESRWTIFRDITYKSEECKECKYFLEHRCVGSCPIQNIDLKNLKVDNDVQLQLKKQIQSTVEWYCYKKIKSGVP